jgi:hypothetical protein
LKSSFVQPEITMTADNGESFADKGLRPADNNYWSDAGIFSRHDPRRTWRLSTLTAKIMLRQHRRLQREKINKQLVSSLSLSPNRPAPSRLAFIKLFVVRAQKARKQRVNN